MGERANGPNRDPASRSTPRVLAWALVLLVLAIRLLLVAHPWPVHPDETGFLLALGFPAQYPVHHPGYPLWVAMGTAARLMGLAPYSAYQVWSVLTSVIGPLVFYRWLRTLTGDAVAWWMALALGASPMLAFASTTALNYSAGVFVGLVVIACCWRSVVEETTAPLFKASLALAIGISLRPDLLAWLGPLLAWTAWRRRRAGGLTALAPVPLGLMIFLISATILYGRVDSSRPHNNFSHTIDVFLNTSVLRLGFVDGLARNAVKLVANLGWTFGLGIAALAVGVVRVRTIARQAPNAGLLLFLWTAPLTAFLLLIHMTEPGHAMLLVPAGYTFIGLTLRSQCRPRAAARLAAFIAMATAAQFFFYPWSSESAGARRVLDAKIAYQCAQGLSHNDQRQSMHAVGDYWPTATHHLPGGPLSAP